MRLRLQSLKTPAAAILPERDITVANKPSEAQSIPFISFRAKAMAPDYNPSKSAPASPTAFTLKCFRRFPALLIEIQITVQNDCVIKFDNIHKVYHTGEVDVHAVQGVSLEI